MGMAFHKSAFGRRCLAVVLAVCVLLADPSNTIADTDLLVTPDICESPDNYAELLDDVNLSADEHEMLSELCLTSSAITAVRAFNQSWTTAHNCIPDGVLCEESSWCDKGGVCTTVCKRGSVEVDPWLRFALKYQRDLSRSQPLCRAQLMGSHNSGITAADGYGNRDAVFQRYLAFIKWAGSSSTLRTNNQWLSLTDQLNLGVRVLELDTHWVKGTLRVAHCGGLHLKHLNELIKVFNLLAKIFHHPIQWDSETVGCRPCLSSMRASEQRTLVDAFQEVSAWMQADGNQDEFVVLFFDDQLDLKQWGKLQDLLDAVTSVFDLDIIMTPSEWRHLMQGVWPSTNTLVAMGKRLLLVSGRDYGQAVDSLIFPRNHMGCGWHEPDPAGFDGPPDCRFTARATGSPQGPGDNNTQRLARVSSCELVYGPLNCDFNAAPQRSLLDSPTLSAMSRCGVNVPSPDGLTPQRAAAQVWAWAPGHPFWAPAAGCLEASGPAAAQCLQPTNTPASISFTSTVSRHLKGGMATGPAMKATGAVMKATGPVTTQEGDTGVRFKKKNAGLREAAAALCVAASAEDGRWRRVGCREPFPSACRRKKGVASTDTPMWMLSYGPQHSGSCPLTHAFIIPQTPLENLQLQQLLQVMGEGAAFIAVQGPDFVAESVGMVRE